MKTILKYKKSTHRLAYYFVWGVSIAFNAPLFGDPVSALHPENKHNSPLRSVAEQKGDLPFSLKAILPDCKKSTIPSFADGLVDQDQIKAKSFRARAALIYLLEKFSSETSNEKPITALIDWLLSSDALIGWIGEKEDRAESADGESSNLWLREDFDTEFFKNPERFTQLLGVKFTGDKNAVEPQAFLKWVEESPNGQKTSQWFACRKETADYEKILSVLKDKMEQKAADLKVEERRILEVLAQTISAPSKQVGEQPMQSHSFPQQPILPSHSIQYQGGASYGGAYGQKRDPYPQGNYLQGEESQQRKYRQKKKSHTFSSDDSYDERSNSERNMPSQKAPEPPSLDASLRAYPDFRALDSAINRFYNSQRLSRPQHMELEALWNSEKDFRRYEIFLPMDSISELSDKQKALLGALMAKFRKAPPEKNEMEELLNLFKGKNIKNIIQKFKGVVHEDTIPQIEVFLAKEKGEQVDAQVLRALARHHISKGRGNDEMSGDVIKKWMQSYFPGLEVDKPQRLGEFLVGFLDSPKDPNAYDQLLAFLPSDMTRDLQKHKDSALSDSEFKFLKMRLEILNKGLHISAFKNKMKRLQAKKIPLSYTDARYLENALGPSWKEKLEVKMNGYKEEMDLEKLLKVFSSEDVNTKFPPSLLKDWEKQLGYNS